MWATWARYKKINLLNFEAKNISMPWFWRSTKKKRLELNGFRSSKCCRVDVYIILLHTGSFIQCLFTSSIFFSVKPYWSNSILLFLCLTRMTHLTLISSFTTISLCLSLSLSTYFNLPFTFISSFSFLNLTMYGMGLFHLTLSVYISIYACFVLSLSITIF